MAKVFRGVTSQDGGERRVRSEAIKEKRTKTMKAEHEASNPALNPDQIPETHDTALYDLKGAGIINEAGMLDEGRLEEVLLSSLENEVINWEQVDSNNKDKIEHVLKEMLIDTKEGGELEKHREAISWALDQLQESKKNVETARMNAEKIATTGTQETAAFEEKRAQLETMVNELGEKEDRYNALSWWKRKTSAEGRALNMEIKQLEKKSDELASQIQDGPGIEVSKAA
jgi:hypothetical protein